MVKGHTRKLLTPGGIIEYPVNRRSHRIRISGRDQHRATVLDIVFKAPVCEATTTVPASTASERRTWPWLTPPSCIERTNTAALRISSRTCSCGMSDRTVARRSSLRRSTRARSCSAQTTSSGQGREPEPEAPLAEWPSDRSAAKRDRPDCQCRQRAPMVDEVQHDQLAAPAQERPHQQKRTPAPISADHCKHVITSAREEQHERA